MTTGRSKLAGHGGAVRREVVAWSDRAAMITAWLDEKPNAPWFQPGNMEGKGHG